MTINEIRYYSDRAFTGISQLCDEHETLQREVSKLRKYQQSVEMLMSQCPSDFVALFARTADKLSNGIPLFGYERKELVAMFTTKE